jgi:excisionase family DNA binding protein
LADHIEGVESALTARELAEILSVSAVTVFKMAKRGTIPSFKVGTCVRFCPRTIARWLRERGG